MKIQKDARDRLGEQSSFPKWYIRDSILTRSIFREKRMFREKCHRGHTKRLLVVISGFFKSVYAYF